MYRVRGPALSSTARVISATGLAAIAALSVCFAPDASAQTYGYGYFDSQTQRTKNKKPRISKSAKPDAAKVAAANKPAAEPKPTGPLVLTVSLRTQRVQVFDANGLVTTAPISSGRVGNPTPMGVYTILEKEKMHHSNLYGGAPMPNMNRITWSGVAMHAGDLPGYPASHGCIRLQHAFSAKLYGMTTKGNRVIVSRDPVAPEPISHAKLFTAVAQPQAPAPATTSAITPAAPSQMADASSEQSTKDIAPQGSPVSAALGVSQAQAAETLSAPKPASGSYREKWLAEMSRLAAAVPEAEAAKTKAAETLAIATAAVEDAKDDVRLARVDADRAVAERKKAERALETANSDLKGFIKKMTSSPGSQMTEETALKAGESEDTLETNITLRTKELEAATAEEAKLAAAVKDVEAALAAGETSRKNAADALAKSNTALAAAIEADAAAKRREAKRASPISVFVSLKSQKLYIRQGHEPILEVPVSITDPSRPIGTHVFTALSVEANGTDVKWNVVSVPTPPPGQKTEPSKKLSKKEARELAAALPVAVAPGSQTAADALDRITFPDDVRDLVADSMKPGSSLLISDFGLSNETGKFTDFIVALR